MFHIDFYKNMCAWRVGVIGVVYGYVSNVTVTTNGQTLFTVPDDCRPKYYGISLIAGFVDGNMVSCSLESNGEFKVWSTTTFANNRVNIPVFCYAVR